MSKYRRGSLTVFFAFTTMMIVSLSFALTEALHVICLSQQADMIADAGSESTFSDYNRFLWEKYGLLAIDSGYCSNTSNFSYLDARMRTIVTENADPFRKGLDFFRMSTNTCESNEYALLSDNNGEAVIREGALWTKTKLPSQIISSFVHDSSKIKNDQDKGIDIEKALLDASDIESKASGKMNYSAESNLTHEVTPADNATKTENTTTDTPLAASSYVPENPVDLLMELKGNTLLTQIFGNEDSLSDTTLSVKDKPSLRTLNVGSLPAADRISNSSGSISLSDKALFSLYLKENYQSYANSLDHAGLQYEWEYLLMGNDCDKYNVSDVLGSLLFLRETENMISVLSDPVKTGEAKSLATAIIGWTGLVPLISALELGIEAAWAYLESILDLRLLMSGGKVSVVKTPAEWTSSLTGFASFFPTSVKAKPSEHGLAYDDYLVLLTMMTDPKRLGNNCLNLLENAMYVTEDYHSCRIDNHVYEMTMSFSFGADPVFFRLIPYSWGHLDPYGFSRKRHLSYLEIKSGG